MAGIPAHNLPGCDGVFQQPFPVINAIIPDPGTGSLYGSTVPMQDTPVVYASAGVIPAAATIVTATGLLGDWIPSGVPAEMGVR